MVKHPVPRAPQNAAPRRSTNAASKAATNAAADAGPQATPEQLQAVAHARGHICKVRNCEVCAPLRERRRLKKAQRKADAQAQAHAKREPCGRNNCPVPVCVKARHADADAVAPSGSRVDAPEQDAGALLRRQAERHRAGVPCGIESCPTQVCVEGFTQERARRHRARRPCRVAECDNPICVASRSNT